MVHEKMERLPVMKVAIVSGSTSGIGKVIAIKLLAQGYFVYLNGRDRTKCQSLLDELKVQYTSCAMLCGDIEDASHYPDWTNQIKRKHAHIDLLVSNVGSGRCSNGVITELVSFKGAMNTNFFSAVQFCQYFFPLLKSGSAIQVISSIAGVAPIGAPIPYACAKAALNMYVKEMAVRLGPLNIRVNSISPGNVMFSGSTWDKKMQEAPEKTLAYIKENVPLNQFVSPEDIADMVLSIDTISSVTGQNIVIDAGQTRGFA